MLNGGHRVTVQIVDYSVPLEPDFIHDPKKLDA
jgi:hypothetical protein